MYPSPPSSSADAKSPATTVSTAPHAGPAPANLYAYAPVYDSDNDNDKNDVHPSSAASASAKLLPPPDYYGTISTPATETAGLVVNHHHYHHYSAPNSPTSTTFASTSAPPASCTSAVASLTKRTLVFFTRAVAICCCFAILTILLAALTAGSMVHFAPGRLPGLSGDPAATVVDGVEWPCGGSAGVDPIRALRQQWIVAQAGELKVNVSGVASGAVRYAGFDVDPEFAVAGGKVVVDVSVHVSHERLIPLVSARGDTAAGLVEVETPESRDMSRIFRECVIASVNVSMVHTMSASASRASNSLGSIKTLKVDTVNLNHYLSSVALRRRSPSTSSFSSSTSSSPSISTRAAPQGWTGLDALAISTTNGHMQLTPSGPWSIHSALSLTTTNGNIDLAGPLRFAGTRLDAESTNGNLHLRAMLLAPTSPATSSSPVAITASTTNGNIDLGVADLLPQARVLASATNGNVLVTAGPDARLDSAKLRAATALGNAQAASRAAGWPRKSVKGNGWMGGVAELVLRKVKKEQEGQQVVEVEVGAGEEMSEEVGVASRGSKKRRDDDESDQGDEGRAEVTASSTTGNAVVAMDDLLLVRVDRR